MPPLSRFQKSCLALAVGKASAISSVNAATIHVDPQGPMQGCSLVQAIQSANLNTSIGDCEGGEMVADAIRLPSDRLIYGPGSPLFEGGETALPTISSEITIQGHASGTSTIARPGECDDPHIGIPDFRLLYVDSDGDLTLENLIVERGKAFRGAGVFVYEGSITLDNATIQCNTADFFGGGLEVRYGSITLENGANVNRNTAQTSAGLNLFYSDLTISGATIANNSATEIVGGIGSSDATSLSLSNATIINNTARRFAGGLFVDQYSDELPVNVTIDNSVISGNQVTDSQGFAGGAYFYNVDATLSNIELMDNYAGVAGGGLVVDGYGSAVNISNSTISGNSTSTELTLGSLGSGGGIYISEGRLDIVSSTVSNNHAVYGGGVMGSEVSPSVNIERSTFSNNSASLSGGALNLPTGSLYASVSTFSGNRANTSGTTGTGGALHMNMASSEITASTIFNNQGPASVYAAVSPTIRNTIIAGSSSADCDLPGAMAVNNFSWFEDASCSGTAQGDPRLNPLMDNNQGLMANTLTHAPLPLSPVLGAGDPMVCTAMGFDTDQRGVARSNCDIGAFEGSVASNEESCFVVKSANGNVITFCL